MGWGGVAGVGREESHTGKEVRDNSFKSQDVE